MQKSADEWRAEQRPEIHLSFWPYTENYMVQEEGSGRQLYRAVLIGALGGLITSGPNADAQLDLSGEELWKSRDYKSVGGSGV